MQSAAAAAMLLPCRCWLRRCCAAAGCAAYLNQTEAACLVYIFQLAYRRAERAEELAFVLNPRSHCRHLCVDVHPRVAGRPPLHVPLHVLQGEVRRHTEVLHVAKELIERVPPPRSECRQQSLGRVYVPQPLLDVPGPRLAARNDLGGGILQEPNGVNEQPNLASEVAVEHPNARARGQTRCGAIGGSGLLPKASAAETKYERGEAHADTTAVFAKAAHGSGAQRLALPVVELSSAHIYTEQRRGLPPAAQRSEFSVRGLPGTTRPCKDGVNAVWASLVPLCARRHVYSEDNRPAHAPSSRALPVPPSHLALPRTTAASPELPRTAGV